MNHHMVIFPFQTVGFVICVWNKWAKPGNIENLKSTKCERTESSCRSHIIMYISVDDMI